MCNTRPRSIRATQRAVAAPKFTVAQRPVWEDRRTQRDLVSLLRPRSPLRKARRPVAVRLPSRSSALGDGLERVAAGPLLRAHVSARTARGVVSVTIVPMVAVTIWLAAASDHLQHPVASALYWSYLTAAPMAIGVYWWVRRPASRFGPLLVAFGIMAWVVSWESSDWALPFDLAVLVEGPFFWLTFYLFLAFPMGRLEPDSASWLMDVLATRGGWPLPPVGAVAGDRAGRAPDEVCPELS